MKIVLIVLGVLALVFVLGIGSCVFFVYHVGRKAQQVATSVNLEERAAIASGKHAEPKDVCSLATADEVGQALGGPVTVSSNGTASCSYSLESDSSKSVRVEVTWAGGALAIGLAKGIVQGVGGQKMFQPVPGLGDEAFITPDGAALLFRKGDVMVNIDLRSAQNNVEGAKKIAQIVVARL